MTKHITQHFQNDKEYFCFLKRLCISSTRRDEDVEDEFKVEKLILIKGNGSE